MSSTGEGVALSSSTPGERAVLLKCDQTADLRLSCPQDVSQSLEHGLHGRPDS
jgi:hypothetical protein